MGSGIYWRIFRQASGLNLSKLLLEKGAGAVSFSCFFTCKKEGEKYLIGDAPAFLDPPFYSAVILSPEIKTISQEIVSLTLYAYNR